MTMTDAWFETREEALEEVRRRKAELGDEMMLVNYEKTGYGTWRVYSVSAELMVDMIADGLASYTPRLVAPPFGFRARKSAWTE